MNGRRLGLLLFVGERRKENALKVIDLLWVALKDNENRPGIEADWYTRGGNCQIWLPSLMKKMVFSKRKESAPFGS